jgi:hypothetical protein
MGSTPWADSAVAPDKMKSVFLGGSCGNTTWRKDEAIPLLVDKFSYFNPQVDKWTPDLVEIEAKNKEAADVLLFVVDGQTRALATLIEVTEWIVSKKKTVLLVIRDILDGTDISGQIVTGQELKDLNLARVYLADVAKRHNVPVFATVRDAIGSL